jgi:hypothetical protein
MDFVIVCMFVSPVLRLVFMAMPRDGHSNGRQTIC